MGSLESSYHVQVIEGEVVVALVVNGDVFGLLFDTQYPDLAQNHRGIESRLRLCDDQVTLLIAK